MEKRFTRPQTLLLFYLCISLLVLKILYLTAFSSVVSGYSGGSESDDQEYNCGSSCHNVQSASTVDLSASNRTPVPGGTISVSITVNNAETDGSPMGVFLVAHLSSGGSRPVEDGWEILEDPGGSTNYNYYLKENVHGGETWTWTLKAPGKSGTYYLYAREHHGNGQNYWQDSTNGLKFEVIGPEGSDTSGRDKDNSGSGSSIVFYVLTSILLSIIIVLIFLAIRKHAPSKKRESRYLQDTVEDGETMIKCPECSCSLKAKNRESHMKKVHNS